MISVSRDPSGRRAPDPLPLSVITGFLGAGKTTLLNRLLKDPKLAETVVIVNEFGEIGLDHLLVEASDGDMLLLSSGCLCCTIRGDLVATLEDLLRKRDNDRIAPFRRVLIETTGLADPAPILHTLISHPYLALRYRLDGVIALVDAANGAPTLDTYREAVKQVAVADRVVLTKTDLLASAAEHAALDRLRERLASLNPGARILDAAQGEATPAALLDAGLYDPDSKIPDVRQWLAFEAFEEAARAHPHAFHGHKGHDHHSRSPHDHDEHDVNLHDEHVRAHCLTSDKPIQPVSLELFLELLRSLHGPQLLRVKGIIALSDDPDRPLIVHGVQHLFHPPVRLDRWPDGDRRTRLVLIARDLSKGVIDRLWGAFTGLAAPDQADAEALTASPLQPKSGGLLA